MVTINKCWWIENLIWWRHYDNLLNDIIKESEYCRGIIEKKLIMFLLWLNKVMKILKSLQNLGFVKKHLKKMISK